MRGVADKQLREERSEELPRRELVWMKRIGVSICVLAFLSASPLAQQEPTIYAESFRKGETTVTEDKFDVKLTPHDSTYRELIKDSAGNNRYEFTITPKGPEGDTKITSWRASLRDLHHTIYSNILVADQSSSADPKNNLSWLNPDPFGAVPIHARRIVKVDGFYVVFRVKEVHFTPLDSPYLDTMVVSFDFTNSDPRPRP